MLEYRPIMKYVMQFAVDSVCDLAPPGETNSTPRELYLLYNTWVLWNGVVIIGLYICRIKGARGRMPTNIIAHAHFVDPRSEGETLCDVMYDLCIANTHTRTHNL